MCQFLQQMLALDSFASFAQQTLEFLARLAQAAHHVVERRAQLGQFVAPAHMERRLQVALRNPADAGGESLERAEWIARLSR